MILVLADGCQQRFGWLMEVALPHCSASVAAVDWQQKVVAHTVAVFDSGGCDFLVVDASHSCESSAAGLRCLGGDRALTGEHPARTFPTAGLRLGGCGALPEEFPTRTFSPFAGSLCLGGGRVLPEELPARTFPDIATESFLPVTFGLPLTFRMRALPKP